MKDPINSIRVHWNTPLSLILMTGCDHREGKEGLFEFHNVSQPAEKISKFRNGFPSISKAIKIKPIITNRGGF